MYGVLVGVGVGMLNEEIPIDVVRDAVYGDLSADVISRAVDIRRKVVERSRGHALCASLDNYDEEKQGKELPREKAYNNGHYAIKGRKLWEEVSSREDGWVDDIFVGLEFEELGVCAEIAAVNEGGTLVNAKTISSLAGCPYMALWETCGPFTLLVRKVSESTMLTFLFLFLQSL